MELITDQSTVFAFTSFRRKAMKNIKGTDQIYKNQLESEQKKPNPSEQMVWHSISSS